jgi:Na+/H+ antiporter NhaD/arsenite permease-like protein
MSEKKTIVGKPVMSLYRYNKRKAIFWTIAIIQQTFLNVIEHFKLYKTWLLTTVMVIMLIVTIIAFFFYINSHLSYNIEKDDELSRDNMNKAHTAMSGIFLLAVAVFFVISIFWNKSVTVTIDEISFAALSAYYILESVLFMIFEGKTSDDDKSEE